MNVKCPKCQTLLRVPDDSHNQVFKCPCGTKVKIKAPDKVKAKTVKAKKKGKTITPPYRLTHRLSGKPTTEFKCPECEAELSDSLENAGTYEQCPTCTAFFITPGIEKVSEARREQFKANIASEKAKARKAKKAEKNRSESQEGEKILRSCGCLMLAGFLFVILCVLFAPDRADTPGPTPADIERLAAKQAARDEKYRLEELKRDAIQQKAKQVEDFAERNGINFFTHLAIIEAKGFDASDVDFNVQAAKDLCRRNYGFLENEQNFQQLRQSLEGFGYDDESALTVFQGMYGVSNENAEAACTEWIATKSQPDWNLDEVMAICLRNKSEGIKTEDAAGSFKVQAARVIQRELDSIEQAQRRRLAAAEQERKRKRAKPIDETAVKYVGRQRLRDSLHDPSSLEIIEEKVMRLDDGGVGYYAKFRARNLSGSLEMDEFYTQ
ncbi:hypothetical protein [Neorhodopirellula lusitana]|uniref:hypothetical protein n=1 Tax=Neorhodopirellula lusitana TaxID=445327 RepID=UPI00384B5774